MTLFVEDVEEGTTVTGPDGEWSIAHVFAGGEEAFATVDKRVRKGPRHRHICRGDVSETLSAEN